MGRSGVAFATLQHRITIEIITFTITIWATFVTGNAAAGTERQ